MQETGRRAGASRGIALRSFGLRCRIEREDTAQCGASVIDCFNTLEIKVNKTLGAQRARIEGGMY